MFHKLCLAFERYRLRIIRNSWEDENGCWIWVGNYGRSRKARYPRLCVRGLFGPVTLYAHRVSWMVFNERDILEGWEVDHKCEVHGCVNPSHLEAVTGPGNRRRYLANALQHS